jgi:hypothetical protein
MYRSAHLIFNFLGISMCLSLFMHLQLINLEIGIGDYWNTYSNTFHSLLTMQSKFL